MRKTDIFPALFGILTGLLVYIALFGQLDVPVDARTVITVGSEPLTGFALQNITTNGSGYATVTVDTLESPVALGSGLSLRNYSGVLQQSDDNGVTWISVGIPGQRPVLATANHAGIMATRTENWNTSLEMDFQISAHLWRDGEDTAEDILSYHSATYGCHVWRFGINASNYLTLTYTTDITGTPGNYTCTTATITSDVYVYSDLWIEVAVRHEWTTNTFIFYQNGIPTTEYTGVTPFLDLNTPTTQSVESRLFEGFHGKAGSLKISTALTWPTTTTRPIDLNGEMTPSGILLLPFAEGNGTTIADAASPNTPYTLDDATWERISSYLY